MHKMLYFYIITNYFFNNILQKRKIAQFILLCFVQYDKEDITCIRYQHTITNPGLILWIKNIPCLLEAAVLIIYTP